MSNLKLPGPAEENPKQPHSEDEPKRQQSKTQSRREAPIPDVQDCLRGLSQLPGLIAVGVLKPAQANAIRASYQEILRQHERSQTRAAEAGLSNADVLDLARHNPAILSMLEPFLTEEQIALIMQDGEGDG